MFRLAAALAASLLVAGHALAAPEEKKPEKPDSEVDAKTKAAIQREVEKAKEDLRNEVRAEIQGAQSAAEFLGAVAEGPKLEFFQVDGYYRFRGQLLYNLSLTGTKDASGHYIFPVPLQDPGNTHTLGTANMRLRLEPTLNVSEHVRVRAQIDVLDNRVLGSDTSNLYDDPGSPYPVPFYGASRVLTLNDPRQDRPAITPKRVWAEIQTPVGLLSFGRMPSEWGLGILTNAGSGLDDDFGDSIDRIQFALPPVTTPIGRLAFVPILDFDNEGVLYGDPHYRPGSGVGQPIDAEQGDDGRTWGLKIARLDTDDEIRRKLERNEKSLNYGAYYNYRQQRFSYPLWSTAGTGGTYDPGNPSDTVYGASPIHRSAYAHMLDLWFRYLGPRARLEWEVSLVYGNIGNPYDSPAIPEPASPILLRQWGGTFLYEYKVVPSRLMMGVEVGAASGDDAPGFGNRPFQGVAASTLLPPYGSMEGPQFGLNGDRSIRNFRFNPAYRVDLILFREILGQVTDAWYLKPKLRWDILPGLTFDGAIIYSRAMFSESTPSASEDPFTHRVADKGHANLGLEADGVLTYGSGDGFHAFAQWGVLQPLAGLNVRPPPTASDQSTVKPSRAHFIGVGLAAKF